MKRYGNLYSQVTAFENLYLAYRKAAKGKRGQGNVAAFAATICSKPPSPGAALA